MSLFASANAASELIAKQVAANVHLAALKLQPADLASMVYAAEAAVARELKVFLEPTEIFPDGPTQAEITALSGKPWAEEPAYDYDPHMFRGERWGLIPLRQRYVIAVDSVIFRYPQPGTAEWRVPTEWIRVDKKIGNLQLVPTGSNFSGAPFGVWLLQMMGAGRNIPFMARVRYRAGLQDAAARWPDLLVAIRHMALSLLAVDAMIPASGSISVDGLSQSQAFSSTDFADAASRVLFGPKGTNGGLWTAIHGVGGTFL